MPVYDISAYVISVLTYLGMAITVHDTSVYLVYSVYLVGEEEGGEEGGEVSEARRWSNNKKPIHRIWGIKESMFSNILQKPLKSSAI